MLCPPHAILPAVDYTISSEAKEGEGYFTVRWCPFALADKYDIATRVPAIGGVAELYYKDEQGKLNIFCLQRSWYGGLRAMLRERCDAEIERDAYRLGILTKHKGRIYYRWSATESKSDMDDVMFFFLESYFPGVDIVRPSGRFSRIWVNEVDAGKLVTI